MEKETDTTTFTLRMPIVLKQSVVHAVDIGLHQSQSELIRTAILEYLEKHVSTLKTLISLKGVS